MATLAGNARHIDCRATAHPTRSCAPREWLPSSASDLRDPARRYDAPLPVTCLGRRSPESPVLHGTAARRRPRSPLDAAVRSPGRTRRVGSASAPSSETKLIRAKKTWIFGFTALAAPFGSKAQTAPSSLVQPPAGDGRRT